MSSTSTVPTLPLAETFYSIQGEGRQTGCPAVFIRLSGCNLSCGIGSSGINRMVKEKLKDGVYFAGGNDHQYADLYNKGEATWVCDSASVWAAKPKITPITELIQSWRDQGIWDDIKSGVCHLVWTGGEPTIPKYQGMILDCIKFIEYLAEGEEASTKVTVDLYNEIETNGTFKIEPNLFAHINQVNCSVKLANSGMEKSRRIVPAVIEQFASNPDKCDFKFVVSSEADFEEIMTDFVTPFKISKKIILLQPGCDRFEDLPERQKFIMEVAKKYGFRAMTRLHVLGWGALTGC